MILLIAWAAAAAATADGNENAKTIREIRERTRRLDQAEKIEIKIETIGVCEQKHIDPTGCRAPYTLYPVQSGRARDIVWDFEKQYTITWSNVDDNYPQQFQWETVPCGRLNKSRYRPLYTPWYFWLTANYNDTAMNTTQRSFTFTFKDLAAEYPKSQCNYTMSEFLKLANSTAHILKVKQPWHPGSVHGYDRGVMLWPVHDEEAVLDMQIPWTTNSDRLEL